MSQAQCNLPVAILVLWRCGSKLEFRETVGSLKTGAPVDFFHCKDCGHVHAAERPSA